MSKLFSLVAASLLLVAGSAVAQAPAGDSTNGNNKPAPTSAKNPNGNVGRPGASSSSANTPAGGEPTGTGTPGIDKKADTHSNTAAAPASR